MANYKVPHLFQAIADYLKTEEGKKELVDYIMKNELYDKQLMKEMKEYANNNSR